LCIGQIIPGEAGEERVRVRIRVKVRVRVRIISLP
jgi:hypothetical protein